MSRPLLAAAPTTPVLTVVLALLAVSSHAGVVDTRNAQCCTSILPQDPPATYYGATMYREDDPRSQWQPYLAEAGESLSSREQLSATIADIESKGGPMAAELAQPLGALGSAFMAEKRYLEAIRNLRRGVHLARVNDGLYTPSQAPMLEKLIAIHVHQGDFVAADEQQRYLYRVRVQHRAGDTVERVEATLHYADWIRGAYLSDLGRARYPRLVALNDIYEDAIDEIEEASGENSPSLLPYLQGRIELSYLISVYPGEQESAIRAGEMPASEAVVANDAFLRFKRMRDYNFRYGLQALQHKIDIHTANPNSTPREIAEAHIALADWHQWHRRYAQAIRIYEEAWSVMADSTGAVEWLRSQLGEPLELPRATIFNPGPMPLRTRNDGQISISFDVDRHGEAKNISFLTPKTEDTEAAIARGYHYLRNVRFRPRLENGKVVRSEDIQRTYKIRY